MPIFQRKPRFEEDTINNRVNNDFFGEICDFKIGYFAGKPISYSYNRSEDSKADTGGEEAVGRANKVLADFVYLNSFPDVDMEVTKFATVCGYSGRLLYHDPEGRERAMPTPPWETILLSEMGRYHGAGFLRCVTASTRTWITSNTGRRNFTMGKPSGFTGEITAR